MTLSRRLRTLQKKSVEKGHWPVVATSMLVLEEESSLDARINLIGSMHEVGLLRNSLQPYWSAWRDEDSATNWIERCIDRLANADTDYWALAGLLGLGMQQVKEVLSTRGYKLLVVRHAESYKEPRFHIATFCRRLNDRSLAPLIEWAGSRTAK